MSFADTEYERWLNASALSPDERAELESIRGDAKEIESRFFAPLEFGTAGLRGVMGAGLCRMNVHVVRWVTQSFAELIRAQGGGTVAVCHDPRNNARMYAETAACVLAANGIRALLFDDMRPTPELSFAVREYGCAAGINVTASHNTREYNGYKVYGANGAQLSPENAERVAEIMRKNDVFASPKYLDYGEAVSRGLIQTLGAETDEKYLAHVLALTSQDVDTSKLRVTYTPFHGAGRTLVPEVLRRMGFREIAVVPSQMEPDGDFPTVKSPNPEYPESFADAIAVAKATDADIIIGTDPDADRVAVLAKHGGEYAHINGHSTGALLLDYMIQSLKRTGKMPNNPVALKTIVTTDLARDVAESAGVRSYDTFTGFKFMAERKDELESSGAGNVIFAYEESYGYMLGGFVRDKDAVSASALIAEMAAHYQSRGMTLPDALDALYKTHGYRGESTVSLMMPGVDGLRDMQKLMRVLRETGLSNDTVASMRDYLPGTQTSRDGTRTTLDLSGSDVLRFDYSDGATVLVRPSGTEPKIKVYILVRGESADDCAAKLRIHEAWAHTLPSLIK